MDATKWHPIACIFPMLGDDQLADLADDIKQHGQREPVVMFEGQVLDGRNRWLACKMQGIEPQTREFVGSRSDALDFVWSTNVHRRHLNSGQASVALIKREKLDVEFADAVQAMREAAPKGGRPSLTKPSPKMDEVNQRRTDHKLAEAAGTSRTYVAKARKIVEQAPELAEKVERGEMTLSQASTEMRREEKRRDLEVKAEAVKEAFSDQPIWTLLNQDVMDGLQSVIDHHGPARLIFTDPPYNIGVEYGDHHDDSLSDSEFVAWCHEWIGLCRDCLTDDGSLWVMINDEYAADIVKALQFHDLHMRAWIKWYETFGVNCSNNFNRTSRHILYFVVDPKRFVFNETAVLRPSDRQTKYGDSRAQSSGKILDDVWQIPRLTGTSKERIPDFPTQLPVELVRRIIEAASEPGDLVVDPFNGSGTTGIAAISTDRKYIGIDASGKYIELSDMRLRGVLCHA